MRMLPVALTASFLHQVLLSTAQVLPAVLAPAIMADIGVPPSMAGVYFGLTACCALAGQMGCGSFIIRHGPMRMSQLALITMALGMVIAVWGNALAFILLALIGSTGAACATPASSQLLGRWSPPRLAPIVFAVKQTAVPIGLLLGGAFAPSMAARWGWRGTMLISAAACVVFALLLQTIRARFDDLRDPTRKFRLGDFPETMRSVLRTPSLRGLAYACFAFNGMQSVMSGYFVIYMTHIGYDLVAAGYLFSVAVMVAIPCRVLWSWLGSFYLPARLVMAGLALGMAASAVAMGFLTQSWPVVAIEAAAWVLSATALSWHGILLSETARLAPSGMVGSATGGVLSFGQMGSLACPLVYAWLLHGTGDYGIGFVVCGLPALFVGVNLLWKGRVPAKASRS